MYGGVVTVRITYKEKRGKKILLLNIVLRLSSRRRYLAGRLVVAVVVLALLVSALAAYTYLSLNSHEVPLPQSLTTNGQCAVVAGGLRGVQLRCWRQLLRGAAVPGWPVVGRGDRAVRAAGRLELLHRTRHQHPLLYGRRRSLHPHLCSLRRCLLV